MKPLYHSLFSISLLVGCTPSYEPIDKKDIPPVAHIPRDELWENLCGPPNHSNTYLLQYGEIKKTIGQLKLKGEVAEAYQVAELEMKDALSFLTNCRREYNKGTDYGDFEKAENYWIDFQGNVENAIKWIYVASVKANEIKNEDGSYDFSNLPF